jgi:hypothetical protein
LWELQLQVERLDDATRWGSSAFLRSFFDNKIGRPKFSQTLGRRIAEGRLAFMIIVLWALGEKFGWAVVMHWTKLG